MKRTAEKDPIVKTVDILQIKFLRGEGTPDNPVREVTHYRWPDGSLIAEVDPHPDDKQR